MATTTGLVGEKMAAVVYHAGPGWAALVADPAKQEWFHELSADFGDEAQAREAARRYAADRGREVEFFPAVLEAIEAMRKAD